MLWSARSEKRGEGIHTGSFRQWRITIGKCKRPKREYRYRECSPRDLTDSFNPPSPLIPMAICTPTKFPWIPIGLVPQTLLNFLVYLAVLLSLLLKTIFFGTLRPLEVEHLYERSWYFFTESMMTLAIFREEFDTRFMLAFGTLYAIKCGHWLSSERVEYMDQMPPPGPSRFYKFRLIAALSFLLTLDGLATSICVQDYNRHRRGGVVLFACEFALLVASVFSVSAKMVVNIVDQRRARGREDAPAWEGKSMWGFYIDVLYSECKSDLRFASSRSPEIQDAKGTFMLTTLLAFSFLFFSCWYLPSPPL